MVTVRPKVRMRILVVDDDRDVCEFMQTFLSSEGYLVETLSDPQAVVERVRRTPYHLVILDIMMPKIDGMTLLAGIRKVDKDVAVVIFTGYPSIDSAVHAMRFDAVDYLAKPFSVDEFRRVIDRVAAKKGLMLSPEEHLHRTIGDTIRSLRKARSFTLKEISRRTGLSVSLLSQIERAESSASMSSLFKIATALGCKVASFFGDY
ncbi:MAG: response regulator [Myxococcota bacterium]|nr:response regulator [Myxococcota bacterium]